MLFGEETGSSVVLVCRLSLIQTIIVNICHFNVKFMLSPRLDFPLISFLIDGNVVIYFLCAAAKLLQSCSTLCDAIDGSPLGSPVPGILQARTVSGLPLPSPMHESENESAVAQSCPTLSDPMDCSLPGFSIHEIFQARVLEWGAIAFSARQQRVATISLPAQS